MFVPSFALIRNIFLNDEILYTGFLVDFISIPVTSGFTSATSIIIIVSQLQGLLGLKFKANNIVDNLSKIFQNVQNVRMPDFLLGICSIAFLLFFRVSPFKISHYGNKYGNKLPFDLTIYLMFLSSSNWKTSTAVSGKTMGKTRLTFQRGNVKRCGWRSSCGFFPSVATLWSSWLLRR